MRANFVVQGANAVELETRAAEMLETLDPDTSLSGWIISISATPVQSVDGQVRMWTAEVEALTRSHRDI